jgi:glycosyltransferase involved in cell wall biosynthesis
MITPRVSILMSVYNGGPYLDECVNSILDQSFQDFEFIIVDDGSTDNSWEVLQGYAERDSRIVLVRNSPNIGVVRALNKGLDQARSELIARQDADDISHPERIMRQVDFLDNHPDFGLIAAVPRLVDMDGSPLERAHYTATENDEIQELLLDYMCLCGPTIMMRRKCLEEVGLYFTEGSDASEDYDICLRLAEVTKLASLEGYLYQYRQQPESASNKRSAQQMFNKAACLERAIERRYGNHPPQDKIATVARDYLHAAVIAFARDNPDQARRGLAEAIRVYPSILERDQPLEDLVKAYTPGVPFQAALDFTDRIFSELLPDTKLLAAMRSRLLSNLHMGQVFAAANQEDYSRVNQHIWSGIHYQPGWLLNRGVWAILVSLSIKRLTWVSSNDRK